MRNPLAICVPLALILTACASTPGANPHDMGVAQHQAMAENPVRAAAGHEAQYDNGVDSDYGLTAREMAEVARGFRFRWWFLPGGFLRWGTIFGPAARALFAPQAGP